MQRQDFEISYQEYNEGVTSLGRNGTFKTRGLFVRFQPEHGRPTYPVTLNLLTFTPITSKNDIGRCAIDIPLSDFWRLVEQMERAGLRNP